MNQSCCWLVVNLSQYPKDAKASVSNTVVFLVHINPLLLKRKIIHSSFLFSILQGTTTRRIIFCDCDINLGGMLQVQRIKFRVSLDYLSIMLTKIYSESVIGHASWISRAESVICRDSNQNQSCRAWWRQKTPIAFSARSNSKQPMLLY